MKISKILVILIMAVSVFGCKKDDNNPTFDLNNANFAGTYRITSYNGKIEQTFDINGTPVASTTTLVGDTFQVNTVFGTNGSYRSTGEYRLVTTVVTAGNTTTGSEIIVVDDSGTYLLNSSTNKITITVDGDPQTFDVVLFNETSVTLKMTSSDPIGGVPATSTLEIQLVRG